MTADSPRRIGRMPNQQNAIAVAVPPVVSSSHPTPYQVASGVAAQAISVLAGVAVGALCSRPIINRTAFSVLLAVMVGLGDLTVPNAPPVRQLVDLLNEVHPHHLGLLIAAVAAETIVISVIFMGASLRLARRKTEVRHDMPGAMEALARLGTLFKGRLWVVSKCGPRIQADRTMGLRRDRSGTSDARCVGVLSEMVHRRNLWRSAPKGHPLKRHDCQP